MSGRNVGESRDASSPIKRFYYKFKDHIDFSGDVVISNTVGMLASMAAPEVGDWLGIDADMKHYVASALRALAYNTTFLALQARSRRAKITELYMNALPSSALYYIGFTFGNWLSQEKFGDIIAPILSNYATLPFSQAVYTLVNYKRNTFRH